MELAYAHALRLRGRYAAAGQRLTELVDQIGADPALFHEVQAAQLELAQVELDTDQQVAARKRAYDVLSAYRGRDLAYHCNAVAAGQVFADARLTLALWDLRTHPDTWRNAADDLRELRDWYAATHGPRNLLTLNTAVAHAQALIALGQPDAARRAVEAVHADLAARLCPEHPTYLQAEMVLGYAAAQRGENETARRHFQTAYEGQRTLLGPTHSQTLRAQLGLGIALKLTGHAADAHRMISQVRQAAPDSVGRNTDLYGQAFVASLLAPLPSIVWRLFAAPHKSAAD
jgi:tetratricopeptide (TPR) repeat protein